MRDEGREPAGGIAERSGDRSLRGWKKGGAEGVDVYQIIFAEGAEDAGAGFVQAGGAGAHVVGVRAEEMDIAVFQELQGLASGSEGQEEFGVRLHQDAEIEEFVPDGDGLIIEITLDMGQKNPDVSAAGQFADFLGAMRRPGFKRHFQKEDVCAFQAELREFVHTADSRKIEDFSPEENPRRI